MPELVSAACLRAISALIESGTFSAAARRLGLSHVTVAQHIHGFEAEHGIRLFDRENGRLVPTPFCQELFDITEQYNETAADIDRLIQRRNPSGRHQIKVGLGNALPGVQLLQQMISHHPSITILIEGGTQQSIMRGIMGRELDVAILPDVPNDPRLRRMPLVSQDIVAIVSNAHPFADREILDLSDLAQQDLIFRARGSSAQKLVDRAFADAGLNPVPRMVVNPREAVFEAVRLNLGVGFIWRYSTTREDGVRRIPINADRLTQKEMIFALADDRNPLIEMMFTAADRYVAELGERPVRGPSETLVNRG